jgi:hypothetical protein
MIDSGSMISFQGGYMRMHVQANKNSDSKNTVKNENKIDKDE